MTKEQILNNYDPIPYCGCWIWKSYLSEDGYGQVKFKGKMQIVSRLTYGFVKGEIFEGLYVCHHCDTPSCMNPEHLFLGTQSDNMQDAVRKGRPMGPPKGEKNGSAKLTEEDVKQIRQQLLTKAASQRELGAMYGVRQTAISNIKLGKRWGWLV